MDTPKYEEAGKEEKKSLPLKEWQTEEQYFQELTDTLYGIQESNLTDETNDPYEYADNYADEMLEESNTIINAKWIDIMKTDDILNSVADGIYKALKQTDENNDYTGAVSEIYLEIAKKYWLDYDYRTEFFNSIEDKFPNYSKKIFETISIISIENTKWEDIEIDLEKLIAWWQYDSII